MLRGHGAYRLCGSLTPSPPCIDRGWVPVYTEMTVLVAGLSYSARLQGRSPNPAPGFPSSRE